MASSRWKSRKRQHDNCHSCGKLVLAAAGYTFCESPIFGCDSFITTDTGIKAGRREGDFKFFFIEQNLMFGEWSVSPFCQYRAPIQTIGYSLSNDVFILNKKSCVCRGFFTRVLPPFRPFQKPLFAEHKKTVSEFVTFNFRN
jgi:hypothetical protein